MADEFPITHGFLAHRPLGSYQAAVTGNGTTFYPLWTGVLFNQSNAYDNTTGIYSAPEQGIYEFLTGLNISGYNISHVNCLMWFEINTTPLQKYYVQLNYPYEMNKHSGGVLLTGRMKVQLVAGNQVKVAVAVSGGQKSVNANQDTVESIRNIYGGFMLPS